MTGLHIPELPDDVDVLTAAFAYAKAGWYVGPLDMTTKHPGSVLGTGWPAKTSREPDMIAAWFAGSPHGLFLHVGRSGAVAFDVDTDDVAVVPEPLRAALADAPWQRSRESAQVRGHYLFARPAGRVIGNGKGKLRGPWGEVRGTNGVIVAAPTEHSAGGAYTWVRGGVLPDLPADLDDALPQRDSGPADAATDAEVESFLAAHDRELGRRGRALLDVALGKAKNATDAGESIHDTAATVLPWVLDDARAGLYPARTAVEELHAWFAAAFTGPGRGAGARTEPDSGEWDGLVAWAVGQSAAHTDEEVAARRDRLGPGYDDPVVLLDDDDPLTALLALQAGWLDEPDTGPTLFALGVAVASQDRAGEPLWGMLVGPPSGGKTERVRMLDDVTDDRVDELTAAALLSWSKHKTPKPVGVLTRIGDRGLLTVGDFSTVLATSDRGGRDQLFASLRRIYDGSLTRDLGNAPGPLRWSGRLSVLAAVTPSIDDYAAHSDALGPRWLYFRMPEADAGTRKRRARRRTDDLAALRARARALAAEVVRRGRERVADIDLDDDALDVLGTAAVVAAAARGSVPRDGYGRREIIGVPVVEEPHRLVAQLHALTRALLAVGVDRDHAVALAARCALDTVPTARTAVLRVLADGEPLGVREVADRAGLDKGVTGRALSDLRAVRLAACPVEDTYLDDDDAALVGVKRDWQLSPPLDTDVAAVIALADISARGVSPKRRDHPPNPPSNAGPETSDDEGYGEATHTSETPPEASAEPPPADPVDLVVRPVAGTPAPSDPALRAMADLAAEVAGADGPRSAYAHDPDVLDVEVVDEELFNVPSECGGRP
ncbi:MAG: bifunctional DNA primase/polymerase [Candidatus Nanopelagicales bacterium]